MSILKPIAFAACLAVSPALPAVAQEGSLSIAVTFGPTAEVPDPRAGYNGWTSNQTGVTETLMGIDYEMKLYPRVAERVEQVGPTTWRMTVRTGVTFHDGNPVTAKAIVAAIAAISQEGHPGHNVRASKLLDLAGMSVEGDTVILFETNSPNAAFPWTLSEPAIAVLGPASDAFPINATGPFVFKEAIPEQL